MWTIITRLPYLAAHKEFPSVGGCSIYNKYLSDGFLDSEKEPIKQLFRKRLPMLLINRKVLVLVLDIGYS